MTQPTLPFTAMLAPKAATRVSPAEAIRLYGMVEGLGDEAFMYGFISRRGRVFAARLDSGQVVICEGEIDLLDPAGHWEPQGQHEVYVTATEDEAAIHQDVLRLFLSQSHRLGATARFAGWRSRVVALVPEEVGPKESTIIRTLADGSIDWTHTYNVLDGYGAYAAWANELAMEFGSSDRSIPTGQVADGIETGAVRHIVQAWLMREGSEAELAQARYSLKLGLGIHGRMLKNSNDQMAIDELARSLHTDRPNLTKVINAAERDAELSALLNSIED